MVNNRPVWITSAVLFLVWLVWASWPWVWYESYPSSGGPVVQLNLYTGYGCAYAQSDPDRLWPLKCEEDIRKSFPEIRTFHVNDLEYSIQYDRQRAKLMESQRIIDQHKAFSR